MGVYEGQIIWISNGSAKQWVKMGGRKGRAQATEVSTSNNCQSVCLSVCLAEPRSILNLLAELSSLHTRDTRHAARDTRHRRKNEWMNGWLHEWIEKSYRCMQSRCAYYQHTLARIPSKNTCWAESESSFPFGVPLFTCHKLLHSTVSVCECALRNCCNCCLKLTLTSFGCWHCK